MKLSFRTWVSVVTFLLIAVILFAARHELVQAWQLLTRVNVWILALLIPLFLLDYYAAGEIAFSYLRAKGKMTKIPKLVQMRMSLEMSFVNHVLPSGGASGMSYMTWRLGEYGVPPSRALMSQIVRFILGVVAFLSLLVVAVLAVTIDGTINRFIILISSTLASVLLIGMGICIYVIADLRRVRAVSAWVAATVNMLVRRITFGKKRTVLSPGKTEEFMVDMHEDYLELRRDRAVLKLPFFWAVVFTCTDVAIFFFTFLALGAWVNPALILIAYGIALLAGFFVITPGGSGAYEALMISFLAFAGVSQDVAIAGIVLARVMILMVILLVGYGFYQHALTRKVRRSDDG